VGVGRDVCAEVLTVSAASACACGGHALVVVTVNINNTVALGEGGALEYIASLHSGIFLL
jgi:hypothetical protein